MGLILLFGKIIINKYLRRMKMEKNINVFESKNKLFCFIAVIVLTGTLLVLSCATRSPAFDNSPIITSDGLYEYKQNFRQVTLNRDGSTTDSIIITAYLGEEKDVVIPEYLDSKKVTEIGAGAFQGKNLTSIIIPDSILIIQSNAFSDNQLKSLIIPNRVMTVGSNAFSDNQLSSVTISNSILFLDFSIFNNNQLTSVTIPENVRELRNFSNHSLTSITFSGVITGILYDKNIFGDLTLYYAVNNRRAGTYTKTTDGWAFNGNKIGEPAIIIMENAISVVSINGTNAQLNHIGNRANTTTISRGTAYCYIPAGEYTVRARHMFMGPRWDVESVESSFTYNFIAGTSYNLKGRLLTDSRNLVTGVQFTIEKQ